MLNLKRRKIYNQIYRKIKQYDTIIIARHIGADPDALGSAFALKELIKLKYPHKLVYTIGRPSPRFNFMGQLDKIEKIDKKNTLLIVLDTPDIKRIDSVNINDYQNIIKIDHHPLIDTFGQIELIDTTSSSTCQLITEFIFQKHLKITDNIAQNLFLGIVSDTNRFMYDYTTITTFKLTTKLLQKTNLNFTNLYRLLYTRPVSEMKFQGYIYKNVTLTDNGLAYIKITTDILKEYNVDTATAGNIIGELNNINEIFIWIFLTEDIKNNQIRVNIRSKGPIINEVASNFGGGGHKYASGVRLSSWEDADKLIEELDNVAKNYKKNN